MLWPGRGERRGERPGPHPRIPPTHKETAMFRPTTILLATLALAITLPIVGRAADADTSAQGKLRHVVLFEYKDGTTQEKIDEIAEAFAALPEKIPAIVDFEWGVNTSKEGHSRGLQHCFLVTFNDADGLAEYLPHPAHQAFVKLLRPHLEEVVVVDYVVRD
jgi:hypothetical protein